MGQKKAGKNCRFDFNIIYEDGTLTAVNLDEQGREINRNSLVTAGNETILSVIPEKQQGKCGNLRFLHLDFTDKAGNVKPLERGKIRVQVDGGELVAVGSACPYYTDSYLSDTTDTYYGRALAVVRVTDAKAVITAESGMMKSKIII